MMCRSPVSSILFLLPSLLSFVVTWPLCSAFVPSSEMLTPQRPRPTARQMSSFFDDIGKFFDSLSGNNNDGGGDLQNGGGDYEDFKNTRILSIPVESLKVGGLRLYISLYLMGQQNTPDRGSWQAVQSGDSGIDVYYRDQTGALLIELCEETNRILVDRLGTEPSNAYLMQESVIIDGLLDELDTISQDDEIPVQDRLIILKEPGDAIDKVREGLAFS